MCKLYFNNADFLKNDVTWSYHVSLSINLRLKKKNKNKKNLRLAKFT